MRNAPPIVLILVMLYSSSCAKKQVTPTETVYNFYTALATDQYSAAFALLDPDFQRRLGNFEAFQSNFPFPIALIGVQDVGSDEALATVATYSSTVHYKTYAYRVMDGKIIAGVDRPAQIPHRLLPGRFSFIESWPDNSGLTATNENTLLIAMVNGNLRCYFMSSGFQHFDRYPDCDVRQYEDDTWAIDGVTKISAPDIYLSAAGTLFLLTLRNNRWETQWHTITPVLSDSKNRGFTKL
ncbi:MAG: hypothetical protein JNM27_21320 [Leptospirales bacterium]|nr:hypothetical protein [Leptospirales bacterium]